nr:MAG TPA: hypothetical protein [Caudoviricetes sp.]
MRLYLNSGLFFTKTRKPATSTEKLLTGPRWTARICPM